MTQDADLGGAIFAALILVMVPVVLATILIVICLAILHNSVVLPWYLSRYLFRRGVRWCR